MLKDYWRLLGMFWKGKYDLNVEIMKGFQLSVLTGSKVWPHKWEVEVGEDHQKKGGVSVLEGSSIWMLESLRTMMG